MFDKSQDSVSDASLLLEDMELDSIVCDIESARYLQVFDFSKNWYHYVLRLELYLNNIFNKDYPSVIVCGKGLSYPTWSSWTCYLFLADTSENL